MANALDSNLLSSVASYYSAKLAEHGTQPRGVDWNSEASQNLRFAQLAKVLPSDGSPYSVNDLGCGYGAFFDFLTQESRSFRYAGFDISGEMIEACRNRHGDADNARYVTTSEPDEPADFGIASVIFNVRLDHDPDEWQQYIEDTLEILARTSERGFAFNCLTSYSDADRMRPDLHYADPLALFDLCKARYSRNVALLHDYDLYEFTILVRKSA